MLEVGVECFSVDVGEGCFLSEVRTEPIVRKQASSQSKEWTVALEKVGQRTFLYTLRSSPVKSKFGAASES